MTSYLAKSKHGMEILTKTLQNRIIKETFAKNRMSKALFVQKKKGYGRTDRHTDLSINRLTRADARRPSLSMLDT